MANTYTLEVITPSKLFYRGEVEMTIVRTLNGDEGFMAGHSWACKLLDVGELLIQEAGTKDFRVAALAGGYVDVKDNIVIFTDAAEWPEDIDLARAKAAKAEAEAWLKTPSEKEDEIRLAKLTIAKAQNRINVKDGGVHRKR